MTDLVPGLVSVVVPIYNVEPFLADCLDSIAAQTYRKLEVIMVDDGSTDGCAAVAAGYAEADARFRLIRQANAGLSAARNNGLTAATGEFLAFVDSDDVLAAHAYELLVAALGTGADFSTGGVLRFNYRGTYRGGPHKDAIAATDLNAHVSRDHALLRDRTVWNKLFRRSFYDSHGFEFPVGRLFEDVPVTVPAHAVARQVAVVAEPVYFWRAREGAVRSITQSDHDLRNLVDRFYSVNLTRDLLDRAGQPELRRIYEEQAIWDKLGGYLKFLPAAPAEFRRTFMELATAYLKDIDDGAVGRLPQPARLQWELIRAGQVDELVELVDHDFRPAGRSAKRPPLTAVLRSVTWDNGRLRLTGRLDAPRGPVRGRMFWLAQHGTRRKMPLWGRGAGTGFAITIDPAATRVGKAWRSGTWRLWAGAAVGLRPRRSPLRVPDGWAGRLVRRRVAPGVWMAPYLVDNQLRLQVSRVKAELTASLRAGDDLVLEGRCEDAPDRLVLRRAAGLDHVAVPVEMTGGHTFRCRFPLAAIALDTTDDNHAAGLYSQRFAVELRSGGKPVPLTADEDFRTTRASMGSDEVYTAVTGKGSVVIATRPLGPVVTGAVWRADGALVLSGDSGRAEVEGELMLRLRGRRRDRTLPLRATGGRWEVVLDPEAVPGVAGPLPLVAGTWDLAFRSAGRRRSTIAPLGFAGVPLPLSATAADGTLQVLRQVADERAVLVIDPAQAPEQPTEPAEPALRNAVLFEAGLQDDPAALLAELTARPDAPPAFWTMERGQPVPPGAEPLPRGSAAWRAALTTCRWVVTNDDLPRWWHPRPGQVVLRLGGGWPVAAAGALAVAHPLGRTLLDQLEADAGKWTALASPAASATPVLRREFRFDGPVLEFGRPGNGLLRELDHEAARAALVDRLGLPSATRLVLYAPTRRPMELRKRGSSDPSRLLDLAAVVAALPAGSVLLVRRHPALDQDVLGIVAGSVDVSDYPLAAELLAASDALLTDYSAVAADFAPTGRPILLYVPDLAAYRESPGLNVDLTAEAPGPLLHTSAEVVAALRGLSTLAAEHEAAAKAFAEAHAADGDGTAAARLVDWLLAR